MKPDPKIRATSRPLRVAYLLEDGCDSPAWLDAIFAECFGRHGGRQSLIVPVENGVISERYKQWLKFLDPDFVMTLTFDNQALVSTLVELLVDTEIVERKRIRGEPEKHPRVGIDPIGLTSLSWLPFLKIVASMHGKTPEHILDRYPSWTDDGFISDNFGTLSDSVHQFPVHQQIGVRGLILTPKDPPDNRWHFGSLEADEVQDGYDIIDRMSKDNGIVTMSQLSNINSQPFRSEHPWTNGFCLIVGDSFEDRVSCWNAGLLFGDAQNQALKTMRVPACIRLDEVKTNQIANFLRCRNWIGGNGPSKIVVRSHSLSTEDLQKFIDLLRGITRSNVDFNVIRSLDDCVPASTNHLYPAYRFNDPQSEKTETTIRDDSTVVMIPKPLQLGYCSGSHPIFSQGCWFVDLDIDRLNENSRFVNVREKWILPNRPQLVRQFCTRARLLKSGIISVSADINKLEIEVKQPEDRNIFNGVLNSMPNYSPSDMRFNTESDPPYKHSTLSDKGRYLQGMLGMFGSLSDFESILSNHFWRSQFESMASPALGQQSEVIRILKLRMKAADGILQLKEDEEWQQLAERIIQISSLLKAPRQKTSYDKLLDAWIKELTNAIDASENFVISRDKILSEAPENLQVALGFLLDRGVFYRGHEWSCRQCSHRNWVSIAEVKDLMSCEVCRQEHQLPIDVALDFRLNEFFATCLREYDTVTVAWALSALRLESKTCFIFVPQTALFRDYPENQGNKSDRELDVCCIVDGQFIIGEVKASADKIAKRDIEDLASVAQILKVDVAILMAFSGTQKQMDKKVNQLRELLPPTIQSRGVLSDWDDSPSYYL